MSDATHTARGHNPICGDVVDVMARVESGGLMTLQFTCQGCALCRASGSIMCDRLQGQSIADALQSCESFSEMLKGRGEEMDGDAAAFLEIRFFPARAKCVLLPWKALSGALQNCKIVSSETVGV